MALTLDSVTKRYGSQRVLDAVSLHVRPGDLYGFIGHNGAGKTTAMRIALGLIRPDSGRVVVDGFCASRYPREARARMGGLIEVPGFYAYKDGATNLVWLGRLQGFDRKGAVREAARLLDVVGLGHAGRKPVGSYSHGMRQRLGIAQAILGSPRIVLLDEPLNGLDPEGIEEMRSLLVRLTRDEGMTILLSSHQLRELSDICNRVGILRQGHILVEAETRALLEGGIDRYLLESADDDGATRVLDRLGIPHERDATEGWIVRLRDRAPEDLVRSLVEAGVGVRAFAPRAPTLEEVYLRYSRERQGSPPGEEAAAPQSAVPTVTVGAPASRLAPRGPVRLMVRQEFVRWTSRLGPPLALASPALLAAFAVMRRRADALAYARQVAGDELASTTDVTAFEGVGVAMRAALPLAALIVAGLASQSIAGEHGRGTLRNILLRPLDRWRNVAVGKGFALVAAGLVSYVLLAAVGTAAAAAAFDFGSVSEILPGGQRFELVPAGELWPELARAFAYPVMPLLAYAGIGFLIGALTKTGTASLAGAFGAVVLLDLGRVFARGFGFEGWLPSAHLPSPLGDTSFLRYYDDIVQGVSNASFVHSDTALIAPVVWCVLTFGLSAALVARRSVP